MSLNLTTEWDKVFPKSDKVDHKKSYFQKSFWHRACGGYVYAKSCER